MAYPKFDYPKPVEQQGGCKVSWFYYKTREEAEQASLVAVAEGEYRWNLGFDFGFQVPGYIRECSDGTFSVTIP